MLALAHAPIVAADAPATFFAVDDRFSWTNGRTICIAEHLDGDTYGCDVIDPDGEEVDWVELDDRALFALTYLGGPSTDLLARCRANPHAGAA